MKNKRTNRKSDTTTKKKTFSKAENTLKQARQQVAFVLTVESVRIDVCCVSETRIQDISTVVEPLASGHEPLVIQKLVREEVQVALGGAPKPPGHKNQLPMERSSSQSTQQQPKITGVQTFYGSTVKDDGCSPNVNRTA
ncbi:hypothetical protein CLF_112733 [Clonorchis sinensis]|uniref:Uncharacterized protein n=1 Tax=Clonorchis sinensis TaxID=79923 RepID=G7YWW3_CLOSI|nr:hypothetical protein CLF_112733 [Clonorchis sinensis]